MATGTPSWRLRDVTGFRERVRAPTCSSSRSTSGRVTPCRSIRASTGCSASCVRRSCTRRNLAALEVAGPGVGRRRAGAPARRARARHRRPRRLESQVPVGAPALPAVRRPLRRAVARARATTSCERRGRSAATRQPDLQRRRCRALSPGQIARAPIAGCPFDDPDLWLVGTVGRMQTVKDPLNLVARLRARARSSIRRCAAAAPRDDRRRPVAREAPPRSAAAGVPTSRGFPASAATSRRSCAGSTASCCRRWPRAFPTPSSRRWRPGCPSSRRRSAAMPSWSTTGAPARSCRPGDADALAPRLVAHARDPDAARAAGRAGRERVERDFSLDAMVGRLPPPLRPRCARARELRAANASRTRCRLDRGALQSCAESPASSTPGRARNRSRRARAHERVAAPPRTGRGAACTSSPASASATGGCRSSTSPTGQQPLYNEDGSVVRRLQRRDLQLPGDHPRAHGARAITFRTKSDTEVIVHAWEAWGERCVERFRGMFAFALWDRNRETLFLARDRLGVKPLYYAILPDGTLVFGSELKSLLAHGGLPRDLDPCAVEEYFALGYVAEPRTIFRRRHKLPPADTLAIRRGAAAAAAARVTGTSGSRRRCRVADDDACDELVSRLHESVRVADDLRSSARCVPVRWRRLERGRRDDGRAVADPVNTCSIAFDEPRSTNPSSRAVAQRYRTNSSRRARGERRLRSHRHARGRYTTSRTPTARRYRPTACASSRAST